MAQTFHPKSVFTIQNKLHMEGIFSIGTTPMGGNLVLLIPKEEGAVESLLGDGTIALENWFLSLKPWKSEMVTKDRSVWLNITGVSLHAWREEFFCTIVTLVGKFVNLDESTRMRTRLDVGRVFATVSDPEAINRVVKVKINDGIFTIRMVENVFRQSTFQLNTNRVIPESEHSSSEDSGSIIDSYLACSEWQEDRGVGLHYPDLGAPEFSNSKTNRLAVALDGGFGSTSRVVDSARSPNKKVKVSRQVGGVEAGEEGSKSKGKRKVVDKSSTAGTPYCSTSNRLKDRSPTFSQNMVTEKSGDRWGFPVGSESGTSMTKGELPSWPRRLVWTENFGK